MCKDCVSSPSCWKADPASRNISPTEAEVTPDAEADNALPGVVECEVDDPFEEFAVEDVIL